MTLETIISAIGSVLNLLMDIPSTTVASSEAKKARAAKILAKLVKQLDEIILRGHKILSVLDTLPDTLNTKSKINDVCDELEELLESQKTALNKIASDIQIDFFVNDDIKSSAGIKFQKKQYRITQNPNNLRVRRSENLGTRFGWKKMDDERVLQ